MKNNNKSQSRKTRTIILIALLLLFGCESDPILSGDNNVAYRQNQASSGLSAQSGQGNSHFEVWLVDQSNSPGVTWGGFIHIYEGTQLMGSDAESKGPAATIDLAATAAALCMAETGANPVRPHMIQFNASHTHAIVSFVATGHVLIIEAATREPVKCIRTSAGAGGARQAHMATPSPDESYILVANQNGKLLERIDSDYATNTFVLNDDATLSLFDGLTPNGLPRESEELRPDNAPICPILDSTGNLGFVTLRGGGLFVVNPLTTPMTILAEYEKDTIKGNGCGGIQAGGSMFINSGGGTPSNLHSFELYRLPLNGYSTSNPPNTPVRELLFADNDPPRDSHGMIVTKGDRYLWVLDRGAGIAEVFDVTSGKWLNSIEFGMVPEGKITPDLGVLAPAGNRAFVSLRGPNPLTGSPHVATGAVPGLAIMRLEQGGRSSSVQTVIPISNIDGVDVERADAHGINLRIR